jgi:hypothetical protein
MRNKSADRVLLNGAGRDLAMTDKTEKTDTSRKTKERPPRRPSYERVVENIDRWINSSGLQKPT